MKIYKEKIVTEKIVHEILCNFCGKPAVFSDTNGCSRSWCCEARINWQNHGPWAGQSAGSINFDICQDCYTTKIKPLMVLPVNKSIYDDDTGKETIEP